MHPGALRFLRNRRHGFDGIFKAQHHARFHTPSP
jgi:hypothetical protein